MVAHLVERDAFSEQDRAGRVSKLVRIAVPEPGLLADGREPLPEVVGLRDAEIEAGLVAVGEGAVGQGLGFRTRLSKRRMVI